MKPLKKLAVSQLIAKNKLGIKLFIDVVSLYGPFLLKKTGTKNKLSRCAFPNVKTKDGKRSILFMFRVPKKVDSNTK